MAYIQKINVKYHDKEAGSICELPALYTEKGVVISHIRYLAWYSSKSESWKERSIFSLKLLLTYIDVVPNFENSTLLLKGFTKALLVGTIDYDKMDDELGLYWKARKPRDANNILFHITHYSDFLALQEGFDSSRINPFRKATSYEERLNWCAYYHKHANVFLNHLSNQNDAAFNAKRVRFIDRLLEPKINNEKAMKFPDEHFEKLLYIGMVKGSTPDYKSQAMTMLLNYGGLRKSELFHLYVSDITLHPIYRDEALVRVYHPEIGRSPDSSFANRREYLLESTFYKPRNTYRLSERLYAGWKSPLLTNKDGYFEVIFNPPEKAKEFLISWVNYLKYQRVEPAKTDTHPFAFTNSTGAPETIKNFQRIHKRAVKKIGLEVQKELGTTEHGHRYAYGYRARQLGLSQVEIQKAMHHKSSLSCLVYIQPTSEDIRSKMREIK